MDKMIQKAYDKNKRLWHATHIGELHHIYSRKGFLKCCLRFFISAKPQHTDDWKWCNDLREKNREDLFKAEKTLLKYAGARKIYLQNVINARFQN